ncbi:MAG: DUF2199 domain-containing protein [Methylovulum sp.]|nr:DUF2199 domain-containing protein [Methylovulum sp.]
MAAIFSFKCSSCDNIHEGSPSFAFRAPDPYLQQTDKVREAGELNDDFCRYKDDDGEHLFIRVCLEVPIHSISEPFLWGVWVSLSQPSFGRYVETYNAPETTDRYFGWFCNYLPYYENTYALKTYVHPRSGGLRPFIELEPSQHPLAIDFHQGISIQKAQEIAESIMHR